MEYTACLISDEVCALVYRVHKLSSQLSYSSLAIFVHYPCEHHPVQGVRQLLRSQLVTEGGGGYTYRDINTQALRFPTVVIVIQSV